MNKKRLEELRKRVFGDYQVWDVKCYQDRFQEASPTGEMDADGKDLTALIDAEIVRQSVTDEAVRLCSTCIGCECEPELGETVKNCKSYVKRDRCGSRASNECYTRFGTLRRIE